MGFDEQVQNNIRTRGYTIVKTVGSGAFGVVYKIKNEHSDLLALKVLAVPGADKPTVLDAVRTLGVNGILEREKVAMEFRHPNIVDVHESFSAVIDGMNVPCIVQGWIDGPNLETLLRSSSVQKNNVDALLQGIASAVGYIHEQGYAHRDIKPANITDGILLDFSIAERLDKKGRVQNPNPAKQSAKYCAPEVRSGNYDARRADVWSLGSLICEVTAGRPINNNGDFDFAMRKLVPHRYKAVIRKCLQKDPTKRYANGTEVYTALKKAQHYYARLSIRSTLIAAALSLGIFQGVVHYQESREAQAAAYAEQCSSVLEASPTRAEQLCRQSLKLDETIDALVFLGEALVLQGKTTDAAEMYERAYVRNPDVLKQLRTRAKTAPSTAVPTLLEFVYQKTQDEQDGLALVHVYIKNNQMSDAARMLHEKQYHLSAEESLAIAGYYEQSKDWSETVYFLDAALQKTKQKETKAEILVRKGDALCSSGQSQRAIDVYREANALVPDAGLFVDIAELWYAQGDVAAAQGALREAEKMYAAKIKHEKYVQGIVSEKSGYFDSTKITSLEQELQRIKDLGATYR